ncbi:hypothetical protein CU098_013483 [Rhizopus stolonifer]|uniref:Yeast cell wall synthesis Kre9/Knh1-like N-terminal domain-containing protein n=1 Tax=Rhizopus stolonifer TaxID=4846 RepID=A0A367KXY6_RHIST|nr:hypothetical protein CU098_013483 [Rhizopus stolonifer]
MKTTLIAAGIVAAASQAMAAISVANPWGQVTWTSGGSGEITWTATAPEDTLNCDIQLLNGDYTNSNLVAQITGADTPIACSTGKFSIYPLNDFASGQYWIRIGQNSTSNWYYSGLFTFNGNGTVGPISTAWTASASATAATASVTPASVAVKKAIAATSDASGLKASAALVLGAVAATAMAL